MEPEWLEATGTVRPELEAGVAAKVMGRIQAVLVREGDHVRRGQPLVTLDARDLDAAVAQAEANLRSAHAGYDNSRVAFRMESAISPARIAEAQAHVAQAESALKAASAKRDLVRAGPRRQERAQVALSETQARSALVLAESNLKRMGSLYAEGGISAQQYDSFKSQYEVAKAQYESSQQAHSQADEGSRPEDLRASEDGVREAEAALEQARASLREAVAGSLQVDSRRQDVLSAGAQIAQLEAALQMARVARSYAAVASPFDGIVTGRLADPGVMSSPGVPLLNVQGGRLRFEAIVPESALHAVRVGAVVPVRLDALPGPDLASRVVEIAPRGDASSHTFVVKLEIPPTISARQGMFGRARFRIAIRERLVVPSQAIQEREGLRYVIVVDDSNTARLRLVTVGEAENGRVAVLSGLNPGERIVTQGVSRIADGAKVEGN